MAVERNASVKKEEILKETVTMSFLEKIKETEWKNKKETKKKEKNQEINFCQKNHLWWLKLGHQFILYRSFRR